MIELIQEKAELARTVFENHAHKLDASFFDRFPVGACGNASDILGQWLAQAHRIEMQYVYGKDGEQSHGWLEYKGYIVDITADQFEGFNTKVFVSKNRGFHNRFTEQSRSKPIVSAVLSEAFDRFSILMASGK